MGRLLAGIVIVVFVASPSARAGETLSAGDLTEEEALRQGLSRPGLEEMLTGELDVASSDEVRAGLLPNPIAAYAREQTFGGPDATAEDYAWVMQVFDLSGRRGLRTEAARRRVQATEEDVRSERIAITARISVQFYDVLQRQRRVEALRQWADRVADVARAIARRATAGDVAAYDRQRAEREHAAAQMRVEVEEAGLERARQHLAALLTDEVPAPGAPVVAGDLLPPTPPPPLNALLEQLPSRPDLRALEETAAAADLQGRASARWWLPDIAISGGLKSVEVRDERLNGFLASGSVPLPLLNRNQDEAMRAAAEAQVARGRRKIELAQAAGELRGVHAQALRLTDAARRARSEGDREWRALTRTAEAAYRGGEGGILELVDAYRAQLEAEIQTLDLEWRARRARVELDRLAGGRSR